MIFIAKMYSMNYEINIEIISTVLLTLNIVIMIFQMVLRAEIKRLDEKINIFAKRLDRLEQVIHKNG